MVLEGEPLDVRSLAGDLVEELLFARGRHLLEP
jgi:hypothetical protein